MGPTPAARPPRSATTAARPHTEHRQAERGDLPERPLPERRARGQRARHGSDPSSAAPITRHRPALPARRPPHRGRAGLAAGRARAATQPGARRRHTATSGDFASTAPPSRLHTDGGEAPSHVRGRGILGWGRDANTQPRRAPDWVTKIDSDFFPDFWPRNHTAAHPKVSKPPGLAQKAKRRESPEAKAKFEPKAHRI